jgi:hypothetical protein
MPDTGRNSKVYFIHLVDFEKDFAKPSLHDETILYLYLIFLAAKYLKKSKPANSCV